MSLALARQNQTGYLPPLKSTIDRIEQYDVVFLGFPTWAMQLPPPIKSFLHQHSLKGKTVIPFKVTHDKVINEETLLVDLNETYPRRV